MLDAHSPLAFFVQCQDWGAELAHRDLGMPMLKTGMPKMWSQSKKIELPPGFKRPAHSSLVLFGPSLLVSLYAVLRILFDGHYAEDECPTIDLFCYLAMSYYQYIPKIGYFGEQMIANGDVANLNFMRQTFFTNALVLTVSALITFFVVQADIWPDRDYLNFFEQALKKDTDRKVLFTCVVVLFYIAFQIYFVYFEHNLYKYSKWGSRIYLHKFYIFREIFFTGASNFMILVAALFVRDFRRSQQS